MDPVFSLGISSLWDELRHMPTGGVWWVNADRQQDAISLVNQTIASQTENANVAVIGMEGDPGKVIKLDESHGPRKSAYLPCRIQKKGYTLCPTICFVLLTRRITFSFLFVQITRGGI